MVRALAKDAKSLIDVGSADAQYIENFDWIPGRYTLDIEKPYSSENVAGIEVDFFDFEPEEKYDFVTCLQVLEHIPDAKAFARKLFQTADHVLISVPYLWKKGRATYHVHDPVDRNKLLEWTGREPDYSVVVEEPLFDKHISRRLISYYHLEGEKFTPSETRRNMRKSPNREQRLRGAIKNEREKTVEFKTKLKKQEAELREVRRNHEKVTKERDRLNHLYAVVLQSRTWRYTLPMRKIGSVLKRFVHR